MTDQGPQYQRDHFLAEGGDSWFAHNIGELERRGIANDLVLRLLELYDLKPQRVLDIGAGTGARVAEMRRRWGAEVTALEPSAEAGAYTTAHYPEVRQVRGAVPGSGLTESFDLVLVHFVLEWVDRELLMSAIAEIDSLVADGGYLLIADFAPTIPAIWSFRRPGQEWVYQIYKQDYAPFFRATGFYREIATLGGLHEPTGLTLKTDLYPLDLNHISLALFKKSLLTTYMPVMLAAKGEGGSSS